MKIMIHGATRGSNFGDILFSDIFYKVASNANPDGKIFFFEMGFLGAKDFLKKELSYTEHQTFKDIFSSDMLLLISGGYFGERNNSFKENMLRFLSYVPLGMLFIIRRKPIIISGIGGGPLSNNILRNSMKLLMDKAKVVSVRDEETKDYFLEFGVTNDIIVTSDTAQIITQENLPVLDKKIREEISMLFSNKKIVLLHLYGSEEIDNVIFSKLVPPLENFLIDNSDYGLIVTTDYKFDINKYPVKKIFDKRIPMYIYNYTSAWQLASLINKVDFLVTTKLHVGIIGSTLSKSVISLPMHAEKTRRYYKQIGEVERCVSLSEIDSEQITFMLEKYKNKPIKLSSDIIDKSWENIYLVEKEISKLS